MGESFMVMPGNLRLSAERSLSFVLCLAMAFLASCSVLKSKKDDDLVLQGTTVSLDELEHTEGLAKPLPDKEPPSEAPPSSRLPEAEGGTASTRLAAFPPGRVRHLRRRVLVLPFRNTTDHRERPYGEIVVQKLTQALEGSDQVVVLEDHLVDRFVSENGIARDDLREPTWTKELHRAFGVHAVVSGSLAQLNVADTKSRVSRDIEVGVALARIEAHLVDASTGNTIQTYTGRNPLYKSKEIGEFSQERAILRAIDIGVEEIAQGVIASLGFFDWSARVVRAESDRVYIDAGQRSGLRAGDILEVYGPGEEIINPVTQLSLGWAPGALKGRIQVSGFFGLDGAYATPLEGSDFRTQDVVKVSPRQQEQ